MQGGDHITKVNIEIREPDILTPSPLLPYSGFVSFDYDSKLVQFFRNLGIRHYHPDKKEWEVAANSIANICNTLKDYPITIKGVVQKTENVDIMLPEGFEFHTKPFEHQLEGVLYGLASHNFLLGDDQGLGKTKQIIDLAIARKHEHGMKHCLIICGVNGNKYNWVEEVATHSDEDAWVLGTRYTKRAPVREREGGSREKLEDLENPPPHFFWITNIETLRGLHTKEGRKHVFPIADAINKLCEEGTIGMIAFDEAHKARNPNSLQGRALLSLNHPDTYKIPMSGTFVVNKPLDLYVPLHWAGFENHSYWQFQQQYCRFGGFGGSEVIGYKNLDELRAVLADVMLRRTKREVLDLPPKVHHVEYVDMYGAQDRIYREVLEATRREINKIRLSNDPLAQMLRLRQTTAYPGILSDSVTESSKMDRMVELVEESITQNNKVIVYSQWTQVTDVIMKKLSEHNPALITGQVASDVRMEEVHRFQNDPNCNVIVGTIGAMGTGLTLNAANTVIFVDEPWNRATKDQAEDRAHRIGSVGTVSVITLICKNTIDERILDVVHRKGRMSDMLLDGKVPDMRDPGLIEYLLS